MASVTIKGDGFKRARNLAKVQKRVLSRATNETTRSMRAKAGTHIKEGYYIKAGDAKRAMKTRRATPNRLRGGILAQGRPAPLSQFRHVPRNPAHLTKRGRPPKVGVGIRVRRGTATKRLPHTFVAMMASGHKGIFLRGFKQGRYYPSAPRLPIHELMGPSIPRILSKREAARMIQKHARTRYNKTIARQLAWAKQQGLM